MILIMKTIHATHAGSSGRRRQIIEAALACFTEKGFPDTSVAEICRKAGASTGSVYHHFKSKGRLAAAIYLEGIRDYQADLLETLSRQDTARDGIFAIVRYHLFWVAEHPDWARFLFHKRHAEYMDDSENEMQRLNTRFIKSMSAWFTGHIQAGRINPLPRDVLMAQLLGPCQEFARMYVAGLIRTGVDEAADALAAAAWDSVGRDAGRGENTDFHPA